MNINEQTLARFYSAFAALDADTMARCYAENARFDDPVFSLHGRSEVGGMWRMLCTATRAKGRDAWKLEFSDIQADARTGRAHWEAHYRFSTTGRLVHNIIDARFTFTPDGLIASQRDQFSFWRWSRQALGTPGLLLGWTPFLPAKVRQQASANLQKFLAGKA
jgi:hypothetical protein